MIGIGGSAKTNYNWKGLLKKPERFMSDLCGHLLTAYQDDITPESRKYLDLIVSYPRHLKAGLRLIAHELKTKRPVKLHLIWIGKIILRRL